MNITSIHSQIMPSTVEPMPLSVYWLVLTDRDFMTGQPGGGVRLYHKLPHADIGYVVARSQAWSETGDSSVIVHASDGHSYSLVEEPHIESWKQSHYKSWQKWDAINGAAKKGQRSNYEPWAYLTREAFVTNSSDQFYRGD